MKRITIKEIAKKAGVSVGTVDRVLHNRGEVADKTKKLVKQIAKDGNYSTNVFARNLKLNKTYRFAIILPQDNEYWKTQRLGIETAAMEYASLGVELDFYTFDRQNQDSFVAQSERAMESMPDAVVMAPLLEKEASQICGQLDLVGIPYVFVDSNLQSASPLAFIGQDSVQSGYLAAKLLNIGHPKGHQSLVIKFRDFDSLNKTIDERIAGFRKFYKEHHLNTDLIEEVEIGLDEAALREWFKTRQVGDALIFVPNSRSHQVATQAAAVFEPNKYRVIGYDLVQKNLEGLNEGRIEFIIHQNPKTQGTLSIQTLYRHLILNSEINASQYMPLDILTKENVAFADN
ncbi:substrate-binding domain-containing protein [Reichenbachiella carrageenanivorans]|uniref:Substrate-binding domain-containing protein n=1 Tax=Reichenbachiella carrageenanivorans TaxID=2979869 RepID=A0ABY6CY09_9BACT|nr:substrate-binding domain-containing protein [Reichenbachiella carrageenanivorans]UXX78259.1 substrate-binding domain-containing protein [Reichenbachiella carrageenanivorans]